MYEGIFTQFNATTVHNTIDEENEIDYTFNFDFALASKNFDDLVMCSLSSDRIEKLFELPHIDSDSDDDATNDEVNSIDIREELAEWVSNFNIEVDATGALLKILTKYYPQLIRGTRTIMNPSNICDNKKFGEEEYYHNGLAKGIKELVIYSFIYT